MAAPSTNPLLASKGASSSGLQASLHPLILLTISDYITRHVLRGSKQPLVGALLGQQKGREITIEHAYDVKILPPEADGLWKLDENFFAERLQQYKDVHKEPPLDLVGWWTVSPTSGPDPELLGIHKHILQTFNETSLVLAFHPEAAGKQALEQLNTQVGTKLPLTIFETVYETPKGDTDGDAIMQDDGQKQAERQLDIKLAELPYEVVTGEAEMIAMDFVAKGAGNATAVETSAESGGSGSKGKGKAKDKEETKTNPLNPQEEEMIAFLTSRANAIKMLQSRISQIKSFLHRLPPSYLTDASIPISSESTNDTSNALPHQPLRAILALTSHLPHLLPTDAASFLQEQSAERADVAIVSLLGTLGRSTIEAKELGRTFAVAESAKNVGRKTMRGHGGGPGGMAEHMSGMMPMEYGDRPYGEADWQYMDEM